MGLEVLEALKSQEQPGIDGLPSKVAVDDSAETFK